MRQLAIPTNYSICSGDSIIIGNSMLIIGSIVLFFSIREAIRNTKNQDLDYQKVLMMIKKLI